MRFLNLILKWYKSVLIFIDNLRTFDKKYTMLVTELREKIHEQVDLLTEENDLEDLARTISIFFENRQVKSNYSTTFLLDLENRAKNAQSGKIVGVTTGELKEKMRQLIIR